MLPNHSPLVIAEQFGTLESLYPGRIDLGLGRAPGSDQLTARALRRNLATNPNQFPQDVIELMDYFSATRGSGARRAGCRAACADMDPGLEPVRCAAGRRAGPAVRIRVAFCTGAMMQAIALYRATFKPSAQLAKPYVMLGFNVFAADTEEQAQFLATSMQQAFVNLRSGHPKRLQPPVQGYLDSMPRISGTCSTTMLSCASIGSPDTVKRSLKEFIERTGADELIITSQIFDHAARLRSYEITAQIRAALG